MSEPPGALADDGGAKHLKRGQRMPDIALPTTTGRSVSFAQLTGRTIVVCYPWTGQPGLPRPRGVRLARHDRSHTLKRARPWPGR
jgi:hypothetical protein